MKAVARMVPNPGWGWGVGWGEGLRTSGAEKCSVAAVPTSSAGRRERAAVGIPAGVARGAQPGGWLTEEGAHLDHGQGKGGLGGDVEHHRQRGAQRRHRQQDEHGADVQACGGTGCAGRSRVGQGGERRSSAQAVQLPAGGGWATGPQGG